MIRQEPHMLVAAGGPFCGMRIASRSVMSVLAPKLLGTYELELHALLSSIRRRKYDVIGNIGCGDGYYAVGLARWFEDLQVAAFDTDLVACGLTREIAELNGVGQRVEVADHGADTWLRSLGDRRAFVLMDCEGAEVDLLVPDVAAALKGSELLVELHDCFRPGVTEALLERFHSSHTAALIDAVEREPVLSEHRPPGMRWLFLEPRSGPPVMPGSVVVAQCARGDQSCLLGATMEHHRAYCERHGFHYECRLEWQPANRAANWDKIALLRELMAKGYEYLVWLDADTVIVDFERDMRDALNPNNWLGMVRHGDPGYFNNGAMYLRNVPHAEDFLSEVWHTWPVYHLWEDNQAVILAAARLPERWSGIETISNEWNCTPGASDHPNPVVLGWHGGGPPENRLANMLQALHQTRG